MKECMCVGYPGERDRERVEGKWERLKKVVYKRVYKINERGHRGTGRSTPRQVKEENEVVKAEARNGSTMSTPGSVRISRKE